jgi:hypothetical protein
MNSSLILMNVLLHSMGNPEKWVPTPPRSKSIPYTALLNDYGVEKHLFGRVHSVPPKEQPPRNLSGKRTKQISNAGKRGSLLRRRGKPSQVKLSGNKDSGGQPYWRPHEHFIALVNDTWFLP